MSKFIPFPDENLKRFTVLNAKRQIQHKIFSMKMMHKPEQASQGFLCQLRQICNRKEEEELELVNKLEASLLYCSGPRRNQSANLDCLQKLQSSRLERHFFLYFVILVQRVESAHLCFVLLCFISS